MAYSDIDMQLELLDIEEEEDDDELMLALVATFIKNKKRKHSCWVHFINEDREIYGAYSHLVHQLQFDDAKFKAYFRLNIEQFEQLEREVGPYLVKYSRTRKTISPRERLAICIRFLATGESFASIAFDYRVGKQTVSTIIQEVCQVLWDKLAPQHMKFPETATDWKEIAVNFEVRRDFPHCLGAIDGKHVVIQCPANSGSQYFNYKGTFSIVLMAVADANYQFVTIDVGAYGRNSDGGIFNNCQFGKAFNENKLALPSAEKIKGAERLGEMPYCFIGDEAFPLKTNLMRPYPGRGCPYQQQIFNYRLSRARRLVECTFGIMAVRWRVFHTKISCNPSLARKIVKACCVLHNMLQKQTSRKLTKAMIRQYENESVASLRDMPGRGNRYGIAAEDVRKSFADYFVNINPLTWQHERVTRGQFN